MTLRGGSTTARPQNWEAGSTSSVEPRGSMWDGASMWVPVWEAMVNWVSRNPSRVREPVGLMEGAAEPGYMGISGVMVWVRSIIMGGSFLSFHAAGHGAFSKFWESGSPLVREAQQVVHACLKISGQKDQLCGGDVDASGLDCLIMALGFSKQLGHRLLRDLAVPAQLLQALGKNRQNHIHRGVPFY